MINGGQSVSASRIVVVLQLVPGVLTTSMELLRSRSPTELLRLLPMSALCCLFLLLAMPLVSGQRTAGMVVQLTDKGISEFRRAAVAVASKQLPKLKLKNKIEGNVRTIKLSVTNIRVDHFRPPNRFDIQLLPNNRAQMKITFDGLDISIKAHLHTNIDNLRDSEIKVSIKKMSLSVSLHIYATPDGKPSLRIIDCSGEVKFLYLNIQSGGRSVANEDAIAENMRNAINNNMCLLLKGKGMKVMNNYLRKFPTKMPLLESVLAGGKGAGSSKAKIFLDQLLASRRTNSEDLARNVILDYGLVADPVVPNAKVFDILSRGEVSWGGRGGTPFAPKRVATGTRTNKMVNLYLTDYVFNSLFYHMFSHGAFEYRASANNALFSSFLSTSCGNVNCIGGIFPQFASRFSGASPELLVKATAPPTFHNGVIAIKGTMSIQAVRGASRQPVLTISFVAKFKASLAERGENVYLNVATADFIQTVVGNQIGAGQRELSAFRDQVKQTVARKVAEIFTEDFPIPSFYFIKIRNVSVHSVPNAYLLAMDLFIDQQELSKLLRQGIQNMSFN